MLSVAGKDISRLIGDTMNVLLEKFAITSALKYFDFNVAIN